VTNPVNPTDQPPLIEQPDTKIPENSQDNLDSKLDHAIEETFPTSDPVSVTVTKGGAIDYEAQETKTSASPNREGSQVRATVEGLVDQAKEALRNTSDSASGAARKAYDQGTEYVRQASEAYPQAERYYRDGSRAVAQRLTENPLLSLLIAGVVGYALAWMIHGTSGGGNGNIPDYARTRRRYGAGR
jgi:ElaB/YqjD/DUF883 family membrane-anchored ribosome-binding protein